MKSPPNIYTTEPVAHGACRFYPALCAVPAVTLPAEGYSVPLCHRHGIIPLMINTFHKAYQFVLEQKVCTVFDSRFTRALNCS